MKSFDVGTNLQFDDYYDPVVANSKSFDSYNGNIMERIQKKLHLNTNELKVNP